ncbi:MAG TPA: VC0807 family protein [Thiolinea sp.]|nr:VC0807 family protein [Thiolinea sp.]
MSDTGNDHPLVNRKENPFLNLLVNILIPAFILFFLANDRYLGPHLGFVVALSFPLLYGLHDFFSQKKMNWISLLGVVNVALTGGIGLLKLDNQWLAIKEAAVPAVIGLIVLGSLKTRYPLIRTLFYNDLILDTGKVDQALEQHRSKPDFDALLVRATVILSSSFLLSSILNFILARLIVVSEPGSEAYNQELGKMTLMSYPVIVVPSMLIMVFAFWILYRGIRRLTGLEAEDIFRIK